jgi:hypothetical protein
MEFGKYLKKNTSGTNNQVNILTALQLAIGIKTSHCALCEPLNKEIYQPELRQDKNWS